MKKTKKKCFSSKENKTIIKELCKKKGENKKMFGKDFEKFIIENVVFEPVGYNQNIYFNIEKGEFWIQSYFCNEPLSPTSDEENILVFRIPNNFDWEVWNGCESCENCGTDDCPYNECMAESLNEYVIHDR